MSLFDTIGNWFDGMTSRSFKTNSHLMDNIDIKSPNLDDPWYGPNNSARLATGNDAGYLKESDIKALIEEAFIGSSDSSPVGLQRIENEKARAHATAERIAAQEFNTLEASKAREFSKMLSDTSYQRGMADLKASGLNPLLALPNSGAWAGNSYNAHIQQSPAQASSTGENSLKMLAQIVSLMAGSITDIASLFNPVSKVTKTATNKYKPGEQGKVVGLFDKVFKK